MAADAAGLLRGFLRALGLDDPRAKPMIIPPRKKSGRTDNHALSFHFIMTSYCAGKLERWWPTPVALL
jgi:hypothetical protein